jgi:hypothetical protein
METHFLTNVLFYSSSSGVTISSNELNSAGATFWLSLPQNKTSKQVHFQLKLVTYKKYLLKVTQSSPCLWPSFLTQTPSFSGIHPQSDLIWV